MSRFSAFSTKTLQSSVVQQIIQAGIRYTEKDFIATEATIDGNTASIISQLQKEQHTVVFTSGKAVEVLARHIHPPVEWKVYCLSGNTSEQVAGVLKAQPFATADNAAGLARRVIIDSAQEVVFFCGEQRRDELPELLLHAGVKVFEVVVYRTTLQPAKVMEDHDAVLFFSPSAVKSFFSMNELQDSTACFAIGGTTADEIKKYSDRTIMTAANPSQEAMAAVLIDYYKQKTR